MAGNRKVQNLVLNLVKKSSMCWFIHHHVCRLTDVKSPSRLRPTLPNACCLNHHIYWTMNHQKPCFRIGIIFTHHSYSSWTSQYSPPNLHVPTNFQIHFNPNLPISYSPSIVLPIFFLLKKKMPHPTDLPSAPRFPLYRPFDLRLAGQARRFVGEEVALWQDNPWEKLAISQGVGADLSHS